MLNKHVDRRLDPMLDTCDEQWGIEDPQITQVGDDERLGVPQSPEDKDAALFPRRVFRLCRQRTASAIVEVSVHIHS